MPTFVLTVMDPFVAAIFMIVIGLPIQLLFNLLWLGGLKLFKIKGAASRAEIFWWSFFLCACFTLIVALHNTVGPFAVISKLQDFYATDRRNFKIQITEVVAFWVLVSVVCTLLVKNGENEI